MARSSITRLESDTAFGTRNRNEECRAVGQVILATRPYPVHLTLGQGPAGSDFGLQDHGTAFVDALEQRPPSFGSLALLSDKDRMPISRRNLERLLALMTLDELAMNRLDEGFRVSSVRIIQVTEFVPNVKAQNRNIVLQTIYNTQLT